MQYYETIVNGFTKSGTKVTDLSRIKALLKAVGDPQERLRFVHVAGTNGKGSCCEMLSKTLSAAGYKTGLFTSPYILRYNDRIRVNGEDISDSDLNRLAQRIEPHINRLGHMGFSQFEITQAMAFLYFAEVGCDIVVLETGLGGRLDSTNVIRSPEVSVICSVSLDHTTILGDTPAQIAEQKAGIIKSGCPAVLAPENLPEVVQTVKRQAVQCGSSLSVPDIKKLSVRQCGAFGSCFEYKGELYEVKMGGYHQIKNAATVIETAWILRNGGFERIDTASVKKGLTAQIPGRIQRLSESPLIICDGGHNPDAVKALCETLRTLPRKKTVVIGMLGDKDSEAAAGYLAECADRFVCIDSFYPNARNRKELAEMIRKKGGKAEASELSAEQTVRREIAEMNENDCLVISGSLFLAAIFADGRIVSAALSEKK